MGDLFKKMWAYEKWHQMLRGEITLKELIEVTNDNQLDLFERGEKWK